MCIHIYIYIERERDIDRYIERGIKRERGREREIPNAVTFREGS